MPVRFTHPRRRIAPRDRRDHRPVPAPLRLTLQRAAPPIAALAAGAALAVNGAAPAAAGPYSTVQAACAKLSATPPIVVHGVPQSPLTIGTFDAQRGVFTYDPSVATRSHTEIDVIPAGPGNPKPVRVKRTVIDDHHVTASSPVVPLVVKLVDNPAPVTLALGTQTSTAPPNAASVSAIGAFSGSLSFTLRSGTASADNGNTPFIVEHRGAGAADLSVRTGCIIVPALPVAIVYQPPVPSGKGEFNTTTSSGVAVRAVGVDSVTGGSDGSIDAPGTVAHTLHALGDALGAAGNAVGGDTGGSYGAVGSVLATIADLLDSFATPAGVVGEPVMEVDTDRTLRVVSSVSNAFYSQPSLGMGAGDGIVYLHNATFAVIDQGGSVTLAPLGYDGLVPSLVTAASLAPNAAQPASLDAASRNSLLALDPVASGNPLGVTDPSRYTDVGEFAQPFAIEQGFSIGYTVATSTTKQYVARDASGAVLRMDLGPSESHGRTVTATVDATGPFDFEVYYDGLFGTFAYVDLVKAPLARPAISHSGTLTSPSGTPLARQAITLIQNGHRITTFTDTRGRYLFRSASLKVGPAEILLPAKTRGSTPSSSQRLPITLGPATR